MLRDTWVVICPKQKRVIPEGLREIALCHTVSEDSEQFTYLDPLTAYKVALLADGVVEHGSLYPISKVNNSVQLPY